MNALRKRRIGAVALVLALLGAVIATGPPAARAAEPMVVSIAGPSQLPAVGETFQVAVSVTGSPGLNAVQFKLTYDDAVVTCTDVTTGPVLKGMLSATNPHATRGPVGAMIAAASAETVRGNGVIGTFTFQVKQAGDPGFGLTEDKFSAADGTDLTYTVTKQLPGTTTKPSDPSTPTKPGGNTDPGGNTNPGGNTGPITPSTPADPKPIPPNQGSTQKFSDVPASFWAAENIGKAAEKNLVAGYEDGTFRPDRNVTRAEFVTMLWRLSGTPAATKAAAFQDVASNAWFAPQVAWAAEKGYVNGKSADTFDPNGAVTRQEAMTILFRTSGGQSGGELMFTSIYDSQFTDSPQIASWAKPALYWAVYKSLVTGTTPTTLSPTGNATRAQIAVILVRYADGLDQ